MYLFFDTETTGLPRSNDAPATDVNNWPRIVQIAWILTDSEGNEKEHADFIIRPNGFSIPKDAAAIHGITTEIALRDGVPLRKALNSFTASIKIANMLVAHNYEFDHRVLIAEYLREGQDTHLLMSIPNVCTMRASTEYCRLQGGPNGYKWPKLVELHKKLFGTSYESAHDAMADTKACVKCFFEMQKRDVLGSENSIAEDDDNDNELFDSINALADLATLFDTSFVDSVNQQYEKRGFITDTQREALIRIRDMLESKT